MFEIIIFFIIIRIIILKLCLRLHTYLFSLVYIQKYIFNINDITYTWKNKNVSKIIKKSDKAINRTKFKN